MSNNLIVGFSGNISRPSSTKRFVESVTEALAKQAGLKHEVFDIEDLGSSLTAARSVGVFMKAREFFEIERHISSPQGFWRGSRCRRHAAGGTGCS